MRDDLTVLSAFLAVAEERSFVRGAKRVNLSPSAVSHAIRGLEERLGVRVLARTTRSVAPTDAGLQLIARLRPAVAEIDRALTDVSARIFEMFMQGEVSSERRTGLGIGLSLARTLTERLGGVLSAHSDGLGLGTEFVVRLPALRMRPEAVVRSQVQSASILGQQQRVLVVDDNRDSAHMMLALLQMGGHEVRVAYDGLAALDAVSAFAPHVVLLDIGLPGISGYETAVRIRRLPCMQPVLAALTGWGQDEDRRKAVDAGFDHHLVKPVDHDSLLKLVESARSGDRSVR